MASAHVWSLKVTVCQARRAAKKEYLHNRGADAEIIAESRESLLSKEILKILATEKKYQEAGGRCEDNQQEGGVKMKLLPTIVPALTVVIGIVWILQGAGLLGGSFMTGRTEWFWIGIATVLAGCAAFLWHRRRGR